MGDCFFNHFDIFEQDSVSTGNEELDAIQRDIRNLIDERREADQAVVQLEADMTIKNSEIKNLQAYFFAR